MEDYLNIRHLSKLAIRIILSLMCGGITYSVWMALFILIPDSVGSFIQGLIWIVAPIVTAMGFATGIFFHERKAGVREITFLSVLAWPLVGCTIGALALYWKGPMLIVFGMFVAGTASVVLREFILYGNESQNREIG